MSCGVVTTMPPETSVDETIVARGSSEAGGRSTIKVSAAPQSTRCRRDSTTFPTMRLLLILGAWVSAIRNAADITFSPYLLIEGIRGLILACPVETTGINSCQLEALVSLVRRIPNSSATFGPYRSASRSPTLRPRWDSARARLVLTVVLPTPPFPLPTKNMSRTLAGLLRWWCLSIISPAWRVL